MAFREVIWRGRGGDVNDGGFLKQIRCLVALLILTFSFTSTGCDGCRQLLSREERDPLDDPEKKKPEKVEPFKSCLLYTSPSPRDRTRSRMPSSA